LDSTTSKNWLKGNLAIQSVIYAVHYGLQEVPHSQLQEIETICMLANPRIPEGLVANNAWNRIDLPYQIQRP
jgi:hypothetical protein